MFTIIIPIKNQFKFVEMCVNSIIKYYSENEIILIDDGSTEQAIFNLLDSYKKSYSHWKVIKNNESLGHTKACDMGIKESSYENIYLLNSDTILTKNCLNVLNDVLNENENIAVVGPTTSSASGEQLDKNAFQNRFFWTVEDIEKYALEIEKNQNIIDVDLVNGFCFGIKKSVFNKIGGFDHTLTCYGNEKELLIRIRNSGFRTVYVKGSYVHHFGKMSYSKENINIGRAQIDADRYIQKKHGKLK